MKTRISNALPIADEKQRHWPSVSIILPFEPVVERKDDLLKRLQKAVKKVEWEIGTGYDEDLADLVMLKLRKIIKSLNYSTFKKSIAIFVSPAFERVLYLNIPVVETITISESFFIRDIVYARKEEPAFFLLVLTERWSSLYEGKADKLIKIATNGVGNVLSKNDRDSLKGVQKDDTFFLNQFLRHVDEGLAIMLSAVPVPVLVMGKVKFLDAFQSLTINGNSIVEYLEVNPGKKNERELYSMVEPYIKDWDKIRIKHLYHQLEKATGEGKLISGISAVQESVAQQRGKFLVLSKTVISSPDVLEVSDKHAPDRFNKFSCVRHAIDDIILNVLEAGGDTIMVDDDVLGGQHIALVVEKHQYY